MASDADVLAAHHQSLAANVAAIQQRRDAVLQQWKDFKEAAGNRRQQLENAGALQEFLGNADEIEQWIEERMKTATDDSYKDPTNMQAKIKKHQTFESEVLRNEDAIARLKTRGEQLVQKDPTLSERIVTTLEAIAAQWEFLKFKTAERRQHLDDALLFVNFKREADEVLAWIAYKTTTASTTDTGNDLEHNELLQKKFEDFTNDLTANEARVDAISQSAVTLIGNGHPDVDAIKAKQQEINSAWASLKKLSMDQRQRLLNAHQIHVYSRDADELSGRIAEKDAMLQTDDCGKDLASVEALLRKHDGFTRDLAALGDSVTTLGQEAARLAGSHPESARQIKDRQVEIEESWRRLQARSGTRRQRLDDAQALQRFLNELRSHTAWLGSMRALVAGDEPAKDVAGAAALLQRHAEHKSELDARREALDGVVASGNTLISKGHYASAEIQAKIDQLAADREGLQQLWEARRIVFEESHELQLFLRDAEQVEGWIAAQETLLRSDELGDSLDAVEALIKRHEEIEKALVAQEEKTRGLSDTASALVDKGHADGKLIRSRRDAVVQRRAELTTLASQRRARLLASVKLQEFLRDVNEAETWIGEKMQTAADSNYMEPTNLQGKLQAHHTFEGEVTANETRVAAVHSTGQALVQGGHYAADTITKRLAELSSHWDALRIKSTDKGLKLNEAVQQQQFQRRIDDIAEWCAEIDTALRVADLGRDLSGATGLLKKHQLLEAEIAGHRERIDAVSTQARSLVAAGNFRSTEVREAEQALSARYAGFAAPTAARRAQLEASVRLQQYLRSVDEELAWITEKEPAAASVNQGRSLMAAQGLAKKHVALQAELAGRQNAIKAVQDVAVGLEQGGHYAKDTIGERRQLLAQKWAALNSAVAQRKLDLDEAIKTHQYFADTNEAEAWMTEKQPIVTNDDHGKDEDGAQALLRKHEAVEADVRTFGTTIRGLATQSQGCQNLRQGSDSQHASPIRNNNGSGQAVVLNAVNAGSLHLVKGEMVTLISKAAVDTWVVQGTDGSTGTVSSDFLRELNESRAQSVGGGGGSGSDGPVLVADRQADIETQYAALVEGSRARRVKLEESYKLHQLNREMDESEAWLDEREALALASDTGTDLEHNELLQARFADFQKDLATTEARVSASNHLAAQVLQQGHSDARAIQARQHRLNEHWARLQAEASQRSATLQLSHGVHKFNRDADEIRSKLTEKDAILSLTDDGRDLAAVEALRRKHTAALHDLTALEGRVKELRTEGTQQSSLCPSAAGAIKKKLDDIDSYWAALQAKGAARRARLDDSLQLQQFLNDHRDLTAWLGSMAGQAANDALATDESGAEALLKQHQELRTAVDAHGETLRELRERGQQLQARKHFAAGDIGDKLAAMDQQLAAVNARLGSRGTQLRQCHELQLFNRLADQADGWMGTREAPLQSGDTGTTLGGVEALLKKHADFEKSLAAQSEKISEIEREAARLAGSGHYDARNIAARKDATLARWQHIQALSAQRKAALAESLQVQQFLRDADEAEAWIAEKMTTACDASYRDPVNLPGKQQRHQAFDAEIAANEGRILGVVANGERLMRDIPRSAGPVGQRVEALQALWQSLGLRSAEKAQKLQEATEQQSFNHGVEDLEFWLTETEALLANRDKGKDLSSVQNLQKKHAAVEADLQARRDRMEAVAGQAAAFESQGHFDAPTILAKQEAVLARYRTLDARAAERRAELAASLRLQQLYRDLDDETAWVREKERIALSADYGKDLTGVQNLQKKHQTFTAELAAHQARMDEVLGAAAALVADRHYAADDVKQRMGELKRQWTRLLELSDARKGKLDEALAFQLFSADAAEEESWLNEKISLALSDDLPDTLATAQAMLKKHEAFETDLLDHSDRIAAVCKQGQSLVTANNYQAPAIQQAIAKLQALQGRLRDAAATRKNTLADRCTSLQFSREADSILAWVTDKEPNLVGDDVGRDLASVQSLLARHASFDSALATFEARIAKLSALKEELLQQGNSSSASIAQADATVTARWKKLLTAAEARKQKLNEALQLHQRIEDMFLEFAQKASQFNSWFENAEEDLTDPVRVNSLDEIKALRESHADFVRSLEGAREKFDALGSLHKKISTYTTAKNPYTWFTIETLDETWKSLESAIRDRNEDLVAEAKRQEDNEGMRKQFAKHANEFNAWLTQTRNSLVDGTGTLEAQLDATKEKHAEILRKKAALKSIEDLGARMEEMLILDNKYTEHSTVSLAQQWDQLEQLAMRMQHNLEQQIQARNMTGVSEEQLREFNETFRFFDKDRTGRLDMQELKSCLRSLGYSLPVVEEGQSDPEFEAIAKQVDPNGDGYVTLSEFLSFMISRETENVESATEVMNAFRAAAADKPYVTRAELYKALSQEQADYCIRHMKPYVDAMGVAVDGGYDYRTFTQSLFAG